MAYAEALTTWGDLGGYELEAQWAFRRAAGREVDGRRRDTRRVGELSGGERKRLVLDLVLNSGADVLLLDEPDNYLDIPTRWWLEEQLRQTKSTVLMVSHDRAVLDAVATKVIVIEGSGAWVHGGSFATFPQARAERQERLGDALQRWKDEERRLFRHMKIMKQRAAVNFKNASKANAAETRWEKFVAAGPPPPPVPDQQIHVGLRGADSARRVVQMIDVTVDDLFFPFSDEVYFGERVGLIGPNGTGKTHLMNALAGVGRFDGIDQLRPAHIGRDVHAGERPPRVPRPHLPRGARTAGAHVRALDGGRSAGTAWPTPRARNTRPCRAARRRGSRSSRSSWPATTCSSSTSRPTTSTSTRRSPSNRRSTASSAPSSR